MYKLSKVFLLLTLTIVAFSARGQDNDENIRQQVLEKGIVDSLFVFGNWTEDGKTETRLRYLGSVTTKSGKTFKIVNSIWIWGLSKRATSRILVFNNKNQYIGNYNLNLTYELPSRLRDGMLIFENSQGECDKKITTLVNFNTAIPKEFFRKCENKSGDMFSFSSE